MAEQKHLEAIDGNMNKADIAEVVQLVKNEPYKIAKAVGFSDIKKNLFACFSGIGVLES